MSILSAIGNTPMVELTNINTKTDLTILGKLEGDNPGGSVKDRPAYYMIKNAEESGKLTKDKIILEPTSGNTGIAIAMIGAAKGYKVKLCMPACVSMERRSVLEAYGAEVVLTPAEEATDGAIRKAEFPDRKLSTNEMENIPGQVFVNLCQGVDRPDLASVATGPTGIHRGKYVDISERQNQCRCSGGE